MTIYTYYTIIQKRMIRYIDITVCNIYISNHSKSRFSRKKAPIIQNPKFQYAIISKLRSESNRKYQILPATA